MNGNKYKTCSYTHNHSEHDWLEDSKIMRCLGFSEGKEKSDSIPEELQNDPVNHPKHYTSQVPGIECIDVIRYFALDRGSAIKYLWRAGEKNDIVEDLKKAIWFIQDEIDELEGKHNA